MSAELNLAWCLADKFHAGQLYGDKPYRFHLEEVETSVAIGTTDERMRVVSVLHDIIEDTDCTVDLLSQLFEDNIVYAVIAITRVGEEGKMDYLHKVKANPIARMVKIHDSFCNLRASIERFDAKRIKKYTEQINFLVSD